jgi:iron-sulfur cluster assembly accessory protein
MANTEVVTLTDAAKNYLQTICEKEDQTYVHLSVKGGGCAGFSYQWKFTERPEQLDEVIDITDKNKLVLDGMSLLYLMHMNIDYKRDIAGAILQLENPNVTSSCGCGESFNLL